MNEPIDISGPKRGQLEKAIVGALKASYDAHGPIDPSVPGSLASAAKRVISVIKVHNRSLHKWAVGELVMFRHGPDPENVYTMRVEEIDKYGAPKRYRLIT